MHATTKLLALGLLILAMSPTVLAMDTLLPITKDQARDLGLQFRCVPSGSESVWVRLEFEPEKLGGGLGNTDFSKLPTHVAMEMRDGPRPLLSTILRDERSGSGRITVGFRAARSELGKLYLRVMADEGLGGVGYEIRVRDVVDLKKGP